MRKYLILVLLILLIVIYLNRSYAYIFDEIKEKNLAQPAQTTIELTSQPRLSKPVIYVALGGSLTAGVGSSGISNTFPYILSNKLNKLHSPVKLINLGIPGATTQTVLQNELPTTIQDQPDIVTLFVGINDLHNLVSLQKFTENYKQILQDLTTKTAATIIILNTPYLGSKTLILPPYNLLYDFRTRQLNQIIKNLADSYHLQDIDLYSFTKTISDSPDFYSPDQFHPSDSGYKAWGQMISSEVSD